MSGRAARSTLPRPWAMRRCVCRWPTSRWWAQRKSSHAKGRAVRHGRSRWRAMEAHREPADALASSIDPGPRRTSPAPVAAVTAATWGRSFRWPNVRFRADDRDHNAAINLAQRHPWRSPDGYQGFLVADATYGPLDEIGWYADNSGMQPRPVAQLRANLWGLYDRRGNVWEWCQDAATLLVPYSGLREWFPTRLQATSGYTAEAAGAAALATCERPAELGRRTRERRHRGTPGRVR
ncbi:MAG: SUMF1/EgtB/PvdO family nonheme iron enzyme [Myxococcota bacterium]